MAVSFKCKISGNVVTFINEVDIITTRENPAYDEVKQEVKTELKEEEKKTVKKSAAKSEE